MKIDKILLSLTVSAMTLACLSSCKDDDEEQMKLLRKIEITGDVEISGSKVKETSTITLSYNADGQLNEFIESNAETGPTFSLSYNDNKVTISRNGEYYGEYTLNSQGYAASFTRPYTATYYHEYSNDGYLIKSTFNSKELTYTYEKNNLIGIDKGSSFIKFVPSNENDNPDVPAFHQPMYLHIPGNIEVKIGYLAGLYGKRSYNLMKSTVTTVGIGKSWENDITVNYTYKKELGYVIEQTEESISPKGQTFEGVLTFTYN